MTLPTGGWWTQRRIQRLSVRLPGWRWYWPVPCNMTRRDGPASRSCRRPHPWGSSERSGATSVGRRAGGAARRQAESCGRSRRCSESRRSWHGERHDASVGRTPRLRHQPRKLPAASVPGLSSTGAAGRPNRLPDDRRSSRGPGPAGFARDDRWLCCRKRGIALGSRLRQSRMTGGQIPDLRIARRKSRMQIPVAIDQARPTASSIGIPSSRLVLLVSMHNATACRAEGFTEAPTACPHRCARA